MKKGNPSINLLGGENVDFFDKFINWALTIGRLVVIVTELIALSAFLYRFSLDRELIDLHSKIKQEQTIVGYLKNREDTYRNFQDRLDIASNFSNLGEKKIKILKDIISFAPAGVTFQSFLISENRISIGANVQFVSSLGNFVNLLKNYPGIKSVSIDKIENKLSNSLINVGITATLSQTKDSYGKSN